MNEVLMAEQRGSGLTFCDSCGSGLGAWHVTIRMELFGTRSRKTKIVQFWLCEVCEGQCRVFLENRAGREGRVAKAVSPRPYYLP